MENKIKVETNADAVDCLKTVRTEAVGMSQRKPTDENNSESHEEIRRTRQDKKKKKQSKDRNRSR